jgi:glycosyltransferase involved in cell wall biosynthesis
MLTVAYLANEFPSAFEPYVADEIAELRSRGVRVIAASARPPQRAEGVDMVLLPLRLPVFWGGLWLGLRRWKRIAPLLKRVLFQGHENPWRRIKALAHTFLGACYAARLKGCGVEHIHVHHGYFGSWIAMTAARLLGVEFSLTLLGSDLLVHAAYLDAKLRSCAFCLTISEYNRRYILEHYPEIESEKVVVSRLGVDVPAKIASPSLGAGAGNEPLHLLTVGRLHPVKNHEVLVRACKRLYEEGVDFQCVIAGKGPERERLEFLIRASGLGQRVSLMGFVPQEQMDTLYDSADVVVLTSRSEGIPLVLMEAMARGKIVLAPAITGIPELVIDGKTGFLYEPGSLDDFVGRLHFISERKRGARSTQRQDQYAGLPAGLPLDWIRHAARVHVRHNFNRTTNLASFASLFLKRIIPQNESVPRENFVLQQIQLSIQRNGSVPV